MESKTYFELTSGTVHKTTEKEIKHLSLDIDAEKGDRILHIYDTEKDSKTIFLKKSEICDYDPLPNK